MPLKLKVSTEEHTALRYSANLPIGELSSTCKFMGVGEYL
jgi:hypothetical protein